jgi:hypothetical protein
MQSRRRLHRIANCNRKGESYENKDDERNSGFTLKTSINARLKLLLPEMARNDSVLFC